MPATESSQASLYQIALALVPGVGGVMIRQLISYCGSAEAVFSTPPARLLKIPGVGDVTVRAIRQAAGTPLLGTSGSGTLAEAEKALNRLQKMGARSLFYTDADYPARLKALYDAPALLFCLGKADLNASRTIALVGTRQATEYGRRMTEELVQAMQPYGASIISGLAYGIDIAAHRSSLTAGLPTVGVMASGLDIIYPAVHSRTAQDMQQQGGLLTEHLPGTKPDPRYFPARNRIIAGLSDAVVVVEAAAKGGALITAEYANNYNREVFAVPGQVSQAFSAGCNKLIRENKAQIYTSPKDLIEALNWDQDPTLLAAGKSSAATPLPLDFTAQESQLVALLRQKPGLHIDELSWQSQIPMGALASLLLSLEFRGYVRSLPGKRYEVVYV
nr:DNA-processing protein DprA [Fibrella aestuarina]